MYVYNCIAKHQVYIPIDWSLHVYIAYITTMLFIAFLLNIIKFSGSYTGDGYRKKGEEGTALQ